MYLCITGDISFHRNFHTANLAPMAAAMPDNTHFVINFESPIGLESFSPKPARQKALLLSPPGSVDLLKQVPTIAVCVGNNHINDWGNEVAESTLQILEQAFPTFGAGHAQDASHILKLNLGHLKIAFLSYCDVDTNPLPADSDRIGPKAPNPDIISSDIASLEGRVDHIIALLHWGKEYTFHPKPAQRALARHLIDSGASLIVGSHPHTVQGKEMYKNKHIYYSLGNTYFPDVLVTVEGRRYEYRATPRTRWGILPVFHLTPRDIVLDSTLVARRTHRGLQVDNNSILLRRFARLSNRLAKPAYDLHYAKLVRWDERTYQVEEFLARPRKARIVGRKLLSLLGNRSQKQQ